MFHTNEQRPLEDLHDSTTSTQPPSTTTEEAPAAASPPKKTAFKYLRPPSSAQQRDPPKLSEQYFQPSVDDIRAQQAALTSRVDEAHRAQFKTRPMREAEIKERRARWTHTTIRVKFADMTMLEKTFPSTDKIKSVYAFVRDLLREDVKQIKFVLYEPTPLKRELKVSDSKVRDESLADLGLAPSSVLLIKFNDDELDHQGTPAPLDQSAFDVIEDYPTPPDFDAETKESKDEGPSGKTLKNILSSGNKTDGDGERKKPKWLKLGSK